MTASALYTGTVRHRRFAVRGREFRHDVTMAYLDLDELDGLVGGRLVARRPGLVRLRRRDHLPDRPGPLADAARELVAERTGRRPSGPVRLLTTPRVAGLTFNPVSFFYCFGGDGTLAAVVAEVTNTPWGERHAYVVDGDGRGATLAKTLHVSPFMAMDQRYTLRAPAPGATCSVHIESTQDGRRAFDATLNLRRRPLSYRGLLATAAPRAVALIYGHGAALALRGVPHHPHPEAVAR
jgi:uncharacterized protein